MAFERFFKRVLTLKDIVGAGLKSEIPVVSEERYSQTIEALAKIGFNFIVAIKPVSIGQLVEDEKTSKYFGHVNASPEMRSMVPKEMAVAINPDNLRISVNHLNTQEREAELKKQEAKLKGRLPEAVKGLISMRLQGASVLAQVDISLMEKTGKKVFTDWSGRTGDETSSGNVAFVYRLSPSSLLDVTVWLTNADYASDFFVLMVVLPQKLVKPIK